MNTILPAPFAWCDIPEGDVTLTGSAGRPDYPDYIPYKQTKTFRVPAFSISKYLISNAQYAKFMEAGGYDEKKWWTDAGWDAKTNGIERIKGVWTPSNQAWVQPLWWTHRGFNAPDAPVVGVSWYEAIAFCRWLSDVSGETISLPTDQQWQRAAQGDDNRSYTWGDEFDPTRCNTTVKGARGQLRQPTPVRRYEGVGDSPFGVVDMLGNVFEWCSTDYYSGETTIQREIWRMMRGGSWFHFPEIATLLYRQEEFPYRRHNFVGFRIAKSD